MAAFEIEGARRRRHLTAVVGERVLDDLALRLLDEDAEGDTCAVEALRLAGGATTCTSWCSTASSSALSCGSGVAAIIAFDFEIVAAPASGEVTFFQAYAADSPPPGSESLALVLAAANTSVSGRVEPEDPGQITASAGISTKTWHHVGLQLGTYEAPDDPYSTLLFVDGTQVLKAVFPFWGRTHLELGVSGASADGGEVHFDNITMKHK